ncbi:MAG: sensor histidine kinase [Rhodothermales bacterium]
MYDEAPSNVSASGAVERRTPGGWRLTHTEIGAIVVFWLVVGLLSIVQFSFDPRFGDPSPIWTPESAYRAIVFACWCLLTPVVFWFSHRWGPERLDWRRLVFLYFGLGLAAAIGLHLFQHALWNAVVTHARPRPVSLAAVLRGLHFLPEFLMLLLILAAGLARDYAVRYRDRLMESTRLRAEAVELESRLRTKEAELKAHQAEARLQAIRTQVNPHFLFNTLNAITSLVNEDPKEVNRMVNRLSEILRYTLTHSAEAEVPLREELRLVDLFFEIQSIRFGDRLDVRRCIAPDTLEARVPSFVLFPVLEQTMEDGGGSVDGRKRIDVSIRREDGDLCIDIRRSGSSTTRTTRSRGVHTDSVEPGGPGNPSAPAHDLRLDRARDRLKHLYGSDQPLSVDVEPDGSRLTAIRIPFNTEARGIDEASGRMVTSAQGAL